MQPPSSFDPRLNPPPAARPAAVASPPTLRIYVRGFRSMEQRLLASTVSAWRQRTPRLEVVDEAQLATADVVMIDCADPATVAWARQQPWLAHKPVVWVDARSAPAGHVNTLRPVQWPVLPILLVRAIETHTAARAASAAPVAAAPAPTAAVATRPAAPAASTRRVLVVDDSLAVRNHLQSLLEGQGHAVTLMEAAAPALELLAARSFDIVLLDVLMPGIDGYEACRQIKAQQRGARKAQVVMLTSKSSPFDRIRGKMAGCDAYLTKPVEPARLFEVLQAAPAAGGAAAPVAAATATEWVGSPRPA